MELLAPVGNKESLDAVLKLKPDAIYFGLKDFNARIRTHNFSIDQANYIVDLCRKENIKTYITLNTLLKNNEINSVVNILSAMDIIKPDALIVQDIGLMNILMTYFPFIKVFASTQTTNLNSRKIKFLKRLNIQRVILERQLTLEEIIKIRERTHNIDMEVFVIGAICYSISGICLFSSFLGGRSANRGLCTQPCRRLYNYKNKLSYLFSIKDLDLCKDINSLKNAGIKGLKIEGRMKPGSFVFEAISYLRSNNMDIISRPAIRLLMDHPEDHHFKPTSGKEIGKIIRNHKEMIHISSKKDLKIKDVLRFIDPSSDKSSSNLKITSLRNIGNNEYLIKLNKTIKASEGYKVLLISRNYDLGDPFKNKSISRLKQPAIIQTKVPKFRKSLIKNSEIYIISNSRWIPYLKNEKLFFELELNKEDLEEKTNTFGLVLPFIMLENDIEKHIEIIKKAEDGNIMVTDEGHLELLPEKPSFNVFQDPHMKNLNPYSNSVYMRNGINHTSFFIEGDMQALLSMPHSIFITLYSRPVLFASRIKPLGFSSESKNYNVFKDTMDNKEYLIFYKNNIYYTVPKIPMNIIPVREKLLNEGFSNFIYDLRFLEPDKRTLSIIRGDKPTNANQYNLKRGLK